MISLPIFLSGAESPSACSLLPAKLTIYIDGGCKGNPGPAGWGAVTADKDDKALFEVYGVIGFITNKVPRSNWSLAAYLEAAIVCLEQTFEGSEIEIVSTGYQLFNGLSDWRVIWEGRGFRNAIGRIIKNKDQWMRLYALVDTRKVSVRWVRGYSGNFHIERCDVLCNKAISSDLASGTHCVIDTV